MSSYASSNSSDNDHNANLPSQIQSFQSNIAFNVPQNIREKKQKSVFIDLAVLLTNTSNQLHINLFIKKGR